MGLGTKRQCSMCSTISTPIWRKDDKDQVVCYSCSVNPEFCGSSSSGTTGPRSINKGELSGSNGETDSVRPTSLDLNSKQSEACVDGGTAASTIKKDNGNYCGTVSTLRKSSRSRQQKTKQPGPSKYSSTKGKGRRVIFKKSATKSPSAVATPVTSNCVFHNGSYYQVGDIVSMIDVDGGMYYAQIKGLLQDQYCEKSAAITWLLPTLSSPSDSFDPSTYILGPEEDIPRKLDCMQFVCNAPSDYYKNISSPYSTVSAKHDACFIWTRLGPQVKGFINDDV